jgi:galactose mutarotase-like enzyme
MRVRMPLKGRYPCERIMATGPAKWDPLCARLENDTEIDEDLDDVFLGFREAEITWPVSGVRVRMTACPVMSHSVIFHELGGRWTCIEPVSMVNNGLALLPHQEETGIHIVPPGETLNAEVRFAFSMHAEVSSGRLPLQDRTR